MTKGFIRYILFLLIVVMLMVLYDSYALFVVLASFAAGALLSLILCYAQSRFVTVSVRADRGVVQKGEKITITFEVENRSVFPVPSISVNYRIRNAFCGASSEEELELQAAPRSCDKVLVTVGSEFCGNIRVELEKVFVYDLFMIFRYKARKGRDAVIAVLPPEDCGEEASVLSLSPRQEGAAYSERQSGDDVSEIFDIREYRPGDSFKRVHRNLSNKMDTLLVKEFGLPLDRDLKVFADFGRRESARATLEAFDATVCDLVRKGEALTRAGIPFFAVWYDTPGACIKKVRVDSRDGLFDALAQMYANTPCDPEPGIIREYEAAFPLEDADEPRILAGGETKVS
ncbi:MAG: DUF58 domain-containing protein [Lachnospiraceae bacterium]|nr:DUF58 domain-containing protein [Lachnospiraceae bacterium]